MQWVIYFSKSTFREVPSTEDNEIKTNWIKVQLFNNSSCESESKFFGADARNQTPYLETQTCFPLQLPALDYIVLKYTSVLNKLLLLMLPRFQTQLYSLHAASGLLMQYRIIESQSS